MRMSRLLVALGLGIKVEPAGLAAAWNADTDASAIGSARVKADGGGEFLPGALELVVVPLAVNVASSALYDLVRRLVKGLRREQDSSQTMELIEVTTSSGDRVVVVRTGGITQ